MNNPLRGLLAGAAAYKWGGGCFGTVIVFLIVYWLLGSCWPGVWRARLTPPTTAAKPGTTWSPGALRRGCRGCRWCGV